METMIGSTGSSTKTGTVALFQQETGAAGIGNTGARVTMIVIWSLTLLYTLVVSPMDGALWRAAPALAITIAVAQSLMAGFGAIVLTRPGEERLLPREAAIVVVCAWAGATGVVHFTEPQADLWTLNFTGFLTGMLFLRGNWIGGVVAAAAVLGTGSIWALATGGGMEAVTTLLSMPVVTVVAASIWAFWFAWVLGRARRNEETAKRALLFEQATREAIELSLVELHAVQSEAAPVLGSIANGVTLSEEFRKRIATVEAGIRDRLRAPWLKNAVLMDAISHARQRGATVQVLGELPEGEPARAVPDALAQAVATRLDATGDKAEVTIRLLPPHAAGHLSLVVRERRVARANDKLSDFRVRFALDGTEKNVS